MTVNFQDWLARQKQEQQSPPAPTPLSLVDGDQANAYAVTALNQEAERVADAANGSRNNTLNTAAFNLGQLIAAGHLNRDTVEQQLTAAAQTAGLPASEIRGTLRSGIGGGIRSGPRHIKPMPDLHTYTETTIDQISGEITEREVDIWNARPVLTHIRDFAYARMASPWAVLAICLTRTLATVPPHVVLPPLIGGDGSLNSFVALVGESGTGKGAAERAAADCLILPDEIYAVPAGSGEGMVHQYAHWQKDEGIVFHQRSVIFTASEVDTLAGLFGRSGSTLQGQLKAAWSGEKLGFAYSDQLKRVILPDHSYRLGMIVGVQPEKAAPIMDDHDGGTPQRFFWARVTDTNISADGPDEPEPLRIPGFDWTLMGSARRMVLRVPAEVARSIRDNQAAKGRGESDTLDGHALFTREKVAQALALLDRRRDMTLDDWDLAGVLMRFSDYTRNEVTTALADKAKRENKTRAKAEGERAAIANEVVHESAVKRVSRNIMRMLDNEQELPRSEVRRRIAARIREHADEALLLLEQTGQIEVYDTEHGRRIRRSA